MKTLTEVELGKLLLMCGAIHDLAEATVNARVYNIQDIAKQLTKIHTTMESILCPETDKDTNA